MFKNPLITRAFFLTLGISLSFILGEWFVRLTGVAPQVAITSHTRYRLSPNPQIIYEPIEGMQLGEDETNSLGYRGPVYDEKRSPDSFRVVVLGDSVTEGLLIPEYSLVYSAKVERGLWAHGIKAEVINFGVNGYNTSQEVETLKDKALRFSPDLIILQYALNDTMNDDGSLARSIVAKANQEQYIERYYENPIFIRSALYRFMKYKVLDYSLAEHWERSLKNVHELNKDKVQASFSELKNIADGRCVLVAIFPWFQKGLNPYPYHEHHQRIAMYARDNNFYLIDLLKDFTVCEQESGARVNLDHVHPSITGHSCAGVALTNFIMERQLPLKCKHQG